MFHWICFSHFSGLTFFLFLIALLPSIYSQYPPIHGNLLLASNVLFRKDHMIIDLVGTGQEFEMELQSWKVSSLQNSSVKYSICGEYWLLGGVNIIYYNTLFERTYVGLPSHDSLYFAISFMLIDLWDNTESFQLSIDSRPIVSNWSLVDFIPNFERDICGNNKIDIGLLNVVGQVKHTSPTLNLRIRSKVGIPYSGHLGFRNISLLFVNTSNSFDQMVCATTPPPHFVTNPKTNTISCGCSSSQYMDNASHLCQSCHPSCQECYGPSENECYSYLPGSSFNGTHTISCAPGCERCSGPGKDQCTICNSSLWHYNNNTCQASCPDYQYVQRGNQFKRCLEPCQEAKPFLYLNDTCIDSCKDPFIRNQTPNNLSQTCNSSCPLNHYIYPDKTCSTTCNDPWRPESLGGWLFCNYPCQDPSFFWYDDRTCNSSCHPLFSRSPDHKALFCLFPCGSKSLYYNLTCRASCKAPWIETKVAGKSVCYPICSKISEYYYEINKTCKPFCPQPLVERFEDELKFCDFPCLHREVLYWDGKCKETCDTPAELKFKEGVRLCMHPCSNTSYYYNEESLTCQPSCEYPYASITKSSVRVCFLDLNHNEKKQIQQIAAITETSSSAFNFGSIFVSILDTGFLTSASLTKALHFIQYIRISVPPKLYLTLQELKPAPLGLTMAPEIPNKVKDLFTKRPLPEEFERKGLHSSFAVGFWKAQFSLGITLTVIAIFFLLEILCRKINKVNSVLKKINQTIRWNILLMILCSNFGDVALYSALEFRTITFDSATSYISFSLCIALNLLGFSVLGATIWVGIAFHRTNKLIKPKFRRVEIEKLEKKWGNFKLLFEAYKRDSFPQQIFLMVTMVRSYVSNLILGFVNGYSLIQTILLLSISILVFVYLLVKRPMKIALNNIQNITYEIIILIVNICMLVLALIDNDFISDPQLRVNVGDIILGANLAMSITSSVFLVGKIFMMIREYYLNKKASKNNNKASEPGQLQDLKKGSMQLSPLNAAKVDKPTSSNMRIPGEVLVEDFESRAVFEDQLQQRRLPLPFKTRGIVHYHRAFA